MMRIAVMQGRLSAPEDGRIQCFPRAHWREEFARAAVSGVEGIEWIDDTYGEDVNPLRTSEGITELRELMDMHGVTIPSICADTFMERPLVRCTDAERRERLTLLSLVLRQAKDVGAAHVGIPLLDNSALKTQEEIDTVVTSVQSIISELEKLNIELHFETSLDPAAFKVFLARLPHPLIRATYDTGNSASLGYDPCEEFAAFGERIGSVHIKDRVRGGGTVALGTGDADFAAVRAGIESIGFRGLYTLQVARGATDSETDHVRMCREWAQSAFG